MAWDNVIWSLLPASNHWHLKWGLLWGPLLLITTIREYHSIPHKNLALLQLS
jgi:hypothetical protein